LFVGWTVILRQTNSKNSPADERIARTILNQAKEQTKKTERIARTILNLAQAQTKTKGPETGENSGLRQ
jgi:hypothetical protein